jgi:hypothetical protein
MRIGFSALELATYVDEIRFLETTIQRWNTFLSKEGAQKGEMFCQV